MNEKEQHRVFDEWLKHHKGLMFKVVHANAFSAQDREDLFQDIAAQVYRSIPAFKGDSKISTWIYRVAIFSAITWGRREGRHRRNHGSLEEAERVPDSAAGGPDERVNWLYDKIRRLGPIDRSLMLLLLEGFSYQEIAETLGISETNVGVKIHRIKKRLASQAREDENHGA